MIAPNAAGDRGLQGVRAGVGGQGEGVTASRRVSDRAVSLA